MQNISVVIPNYNGQKLLAKHLPDVKSTLKKGDQVVIVDDASTDNSVAWLKKQQASFENSQIELTIVELKKNLRFAGAVNHGVTKAHHEYVWLLNNDVSPLSSNIRARLLQWFSNKKLFAVGCAEVHDRHKQTPLFGRGTGSFQRGLLTHWYDPRQKDHRTLWTTGGSMFFNQAKFWEIGGFDTLFYPAYEEDRDLSYRALKKGWQLIFDYESLVLHQHETTNRSVFGQRQMEINSWKNQYLLVWKNISDHQLWLEHLFWLPYHLTVSAVRSQGASWFGFWKAIRQLPQLWDSRHQARQHWKKSDQEILSALSFAKTKAE